MKGGLLGYRGDSYQEVWKIPFFYFEFLMRSLQKWDEFRNEGGVQFISAYILR